MFLMNILLQTKLLPFNYSTCFVLPMIVLLSPTIGSWLNIWSLVDGGMADTALRHRQQFCAQKRWLTLKVRVRYMCLDPETLGCLQAEPVVSGLGATQAKLQPWPATFSALCIPQCPTLSRWLVVALLTHRLLKWNDGSFTLYINNPFSM